MKSVEKRKVIIYSGLLILVIFFTYISIINNTFVFDDNVLIKQNPLIIGKNVSLERILSEPFPFRKFQFDYYRPLIIIYFRMIFQYLSQSPIIFHLFSIFLHVIITFLVFFIINSYINDIKISFLATLVFSVMPGYSEAVIWISASNDLIATLFIMACVVFINKYIESGKVKNILFIVVFFSFGILVKESMIMTIPIVAMIFVGTKKNFNELMKNRNKLLINILSLLPVLFLYLILRNQVLGFILPKYGNYAKGVGFFPRIPLFLKFYWKSFSKTIYSFVNAPFYFWDNAFLFTYESFLGLALIISSAIIWFKFKERVIRDSIALFFVSLVMYSHVFSGTELFADRYLIIPSLSICMILAFIIKKYASNNLKPVAILMIILSLGFSLKTISYTMEWANDLILWDNAYKKYPKNTRTEHNYIKTLMDNGYFEKAYDLAEKRSKIKKNSLDGYLFMIRINGRKKSFKRGIEVARSALKKFPENKEIIGLIMQLKIDLRSQKH